MEALTVRAGISIRVNGVVLLPASRTTVAAIATVGRRDIKQTLETLPLEVVAQIAGYLLPEAQAALALTSHRDAGGAGNPDASAAPHVAI